MWTRKLFLWKVEPLWDLFYKWLDDFEGAFYMGAHQIANNEIVQISLKNRLGAALGQIFDQKNFRLLSKKIQILNAMPCTRTGDDDIAQFGVKHSIVIPNQQVFKWPRSENLNCIGFFLYFLTVFASS